MELTRSVFSFPASSAPASSHFLQWTGSPLDLDSAREGWPGDPAARQVCACGRGWEEGGPESLGLAALGGPGAPALLRGPREPGFPSLSDPRKSPVCSLARPSCELPNSSMTKSFPDQTGWPFALLNDSEFPKYKSHRTLLTGCLSSSPWETLAKPQAGRLVTVSINSNNNNNSNMQSLLITRQRMRWTRQRSDLRA